MDKKMTYEEFQYRIFGGLTDDYGNDPVSPVLEIIQGKWRLQTIYALSQENALRFNSLKKKLKGITSAMLITVLKDLEELKIVAKATAEDKKIYYEYSLTERGRDLLPVFYELMNWGFAYPDYGMSKIYNK